MERLSEVRASPRPSLVRDEPCKIEGILTDALRHSGVEAAPGIRVRVDCAPGLLTHGDPEMLERVFINLCRNAADAMEGNGHLDIRAHSDGNGSIEVDVSDTGCGMTPAYIAESLFRPFASTKQNGLGIGLYQCKNIVDEHGGRIRVESGTEGGTRVQVRLPAATEAQPTCETDS